MTDEERIARAAKSLVDTQEKQEVESTDARLERLLAAQRRQLLFEAAEMREVWLRICIRGGGDAGYVAMNMHVHVHV